MRTRYKQSRSVFDVFTPTTQARVNFIERDSVNDRLVDALRTPGKQIVVYGDSGSGKSTLLQRKLEQLYESHITTRCSAASTFNSILMDTFDQLGAHYVEGRSSGLSKSAKASIQVDIAKAKAAYEKQVGDTSGSSTKRAVPLQITTQRLAELMGVDGLCWIVEDFHKVPAEEKVPLAQAFKIFSDVASDHPDVRIVAIGATETAREVVEYDREMANRVAEILVPLMTPEELRAILSNGEELLNCDMSALKSDIVRFASGLPSVCHHLALNACLAAGLEFGADERVVLGDADLTAAIERYVDESSDTVKGVFDRALRRHRVRKYDNCRLIISAIAEGPPMGLQHAEILAAIRSTHSEYPQSNLTTYLKELSSEARGEVLRQGLDGRFRFTEPLYYAYAQALLRTPTLGKLTNALSETFLDILTAKVTESISTWGEFTRHNDVEADNLVIQLKGDPPFGRR